MTDLVDKATANQDLQLSAAIVAIRGHHTSCGNGICKDCGEPIPAPRLRACPNAIRCIECQSAYEANGNSY